MEFFYNIAIDICTLIYNLVNWSYQIFLTLASTNVFSAELYLDLVRKVYIVLGVVMVFLLAYVFVNIIINPDNDKGGKETLDIVKRFVVAIFLIILCPFFFSFAYRIQNVILESNIFIKFFSTTDSSGATVTPVTIEDAGNLLTYDVFTMFFNASGSKDPSDIKAVINYEESLQSTSSNALDTSLDYKKFDYDPSYKYVNVKTNKKLTGRPNFKENSSDWNDIYIYVSDGIYVNANQDITYHLPNGDATCKLKYQYVGLEKSNSGHAKCFFDKQPKELKNVYNIYSVGFGNVNSSTKTVKKTINLADAYIMLREGKSYFFLKSFSKAISNGDIEFQWLLSIFVGCVLLYCIASFCFDIAFRIVKLVYYQIVAPVCFACHISKKSDSVFNNWIKATISTYISVFTRVFLISLAMFLITNLIKSDLFGSLWNNSESGYWLKVISELFLILGILMFIKQATKLLESVFGVSDIKLDIKNKLAESGFFGLGAAVGTGLATTARNATHAYSNVRNANGFWGKLGAGLNGIGSVATGTIKGTLRGYNSGRKSSSFKDMNSAIKSAADQVTAERNATEAYRASHQGANIPLVGTALTTIYKTSDALDKFGQYIGLNNIDEIDAAINDLDDLNKKNSEVKDAVLDLMDKQIKKGKYAWKLGMRDTDIMRVSDLRKVNSKIEKDLDYYATTERAIMEALQKAKESGVDQICSVLSDSQTFSSFELDAILRKYRNDRSSLIATRMLQGKTNIQSWLKSLSDDNERTEIKEIVNKQASIYRHSLKNHKGSKVLALANNYARKAGGTELHGFDEETDLIFGQDSAIDKLGTAIKDITSDLNDKKHGIEAKRQDKK